MANKNTAHDNTRERILDSAEKLFCENDFSAVSVRQITAEAGCNLGAVNYHFGSKQNLYLEIFRRRWIPRARRVLERLEELEKKGNSSTREIVRTIGQAFFMELASEEERYRHRQLLSREMANPGQAFELVFKEGMRPNLEVTYRLLNKTVPLSQDKEKAMLYVLSILAQLVYFHLIRLPVELMTGHEYDHDFVEKLIDHITDFSLSGLAGIPREECK